MDHAYVYINDILVSGETESQHLSNLDQVVARLEAAGLQLKRAKCAFMLSLLDYLGHTITSEELQPRNKIVCVIVEALAPRNVLQLRSFLNLVNYYNKLYFPKAPAH